MRPLAKFFERMAFFLQRVGLGIGQTVNDQRSGNDLGRLAFPLRGFDVTVDRDAAAGGKVFDIRVVIVELRITDNLDIRQAAAIVEFEEAEARFRVTPSADPALQPHLASDSGLLACLGDAEFFHALVVPPQNGLRSLAA